MVRISTSDGAQWWDQNPRDKSEETVVEEGEMPWSAGAEEV